MTLATWAVWWRPWRVVHVLDDLLAPVALDVDVDVGRPVALGRQEALEQQAERHRVGVGDAERVADRGVGRAAPALAEDVGCVGRTRRGPTRRGSSRRTRACSMIASSWSIVRHALARSDVAAVRRHGALAVALARRPPRRAGAGTASRSNPFGHGNGGRVGATRERSNAAARPISAAARPRRGSGRSGAPARPRCAGGRRRPPAATGRARRGCAGRARRRWPWPGGAGRAWRSARCWWRRTPRRAAAASSARASLRAESSGSPWSHSSTSTRSRPNASTSCCSSRRAAAGPSLDQRRRHGALAAAGEHPHVAGDGGGDVGEGELRRALLPRQVAEAQRCAARRA